MTIIAEDGTHLHTKLSELPDASSLAGTDLVQVVSGGVNCKTPLDALVAAGGGGGTPGLIWEWNQTDLTQFDVVEDTTGFTDAVTTWATRFATHAADETPAIRIDNPAVSGHAHLLLIKTSELDLTSYLPGRLLVEWRSSQQTALGTQDIIFVPYYEALNAMFAIRHMANSFQWAYRDVSGGTPPTWNDPAIQQVYSALGSGVEQGWLMQLVMHIEPATVGTKPYIMPRGLSNPEFRSIPPAVRGSLAAGWNSLGSFTPRMGWGVRSFGAACGAGNGNLVSEMRIWSLPAGVPGGP